jgi:signal transduction histidine kinase
LITHTSADGLASNNLFCVTEDNLGYIYVGSNRGIDRLNPATGRIKHYAADDGVINTEFNSAFVDQHGTLWFSTAKGLLRFTPEPEPPTPPPPVWIGRLHISGVEQPISELGETEVAHRELGPNQNQLEIAFFGLAFDSGGPLRYQYRLEGADWGWSSPTDQRIVNYANLAPGRYRFLVQAISSDGTVSQTPATVDFTILRPVWQRWWFLGLAVLLAAAATYAIYHYRLTRLIELERVRTRIATDLHDDIGSSLSQVSVLSEIIRRRVSPDSHVSEPLSTIIRLSCDLVDSMNDIVWAINPQRDHLSDLTHRMRRFASDAFTARDVEFSFRAPDERQDIKMGADIRREVFLIFKESVTNIVRHSGCSKADIEFLIADGWLELRLSDDGRGFDPARAHDGNGLMSMRQRAIRIGGALTVTSNEGQGTTVRLKAPLDGRGWRRNL